MIKPSVFLTKTDILALNAIRDTGQPEGHTLQAITSVPCFEFWLLLHFRFSTKNFDAGPGSICDRVITELKSYLSGYAKGSKGVYGRLKDTLPTAIKNAQKIANYCKSADTDHPSTQIHELVEYLQNLQNGKR